MSKKPRFVRPPRSIADVDSKNEDVTSLTMLENCCVYICSGELFMVGYRENDLDDVTDMDGLMAQVKPVSLESMVHPPRVIQSFILHTVTCPALSKYDIAIALTCEYSILFCAKGASLSEFHFSEILESYVTEEEADAFAESPSPVTMAIHQTAEILVVATQGKVLVLTLNMGFIADNVAYFSSEDASRALLHGDDDDGYGEGNSSVGFDYSQCVRGALVIDASQWMMLAPDPTTMSALPTLKNAPPMFQASVEHSSVWVPLPHSKYRIGVGRDHTHDFIAPTRCTVVCAGNGNWLEFLPLVRESAMHPWVQRPGNDAGFNPLDSRASATVYENEAKVTDHDAWVSCISSSQDVTQLTMTGDALGYLCIWEALTDSEIARLREEARQKKLADQEAWEAANDAEAELSKELSVVSEDKGGKAAAKAPTENPRLTALKTVEGGASAVGKVSEGSVGSHLTPVMTAEQEKDERAFNMVLNIGFRRVFKIKFVQDHPITSVICAPNDSSSFWVGDHTGTLTYINVLPHSKTYQKLCTVNVLCLESAPTTLWWEPALKPNHDVHGRLRFICAAAGTVIESQIEGVRCIFNTSSGPSFAPSHRSIVEACCVLLELELLVTGGSSSAISIWSLDSGELLQTITSPDQYCTYIAAFDSGYVQGGVARILVGHANGNIHDYILTSEETFNEESVQSVTTATDGNTASVGHPLDGGHSSTSVALSVDILDTLDANVPDKIKTVQQQDTDPIDDGTQYLDVSQEPSGAIGAAQKASRVNVQGGEYKVKYTAKLVDTWNYCPIPVTGVYFSSLGLYFAFVYSHMQVVIHDWEQNSVYLQLELDQKLTSVSVLNTFEMEDLHSDSLSLALHGAEGVRVLDALQRRFINEITVGTAGKDIEACAMWSAAGGTANTRQSTVKSMNNGEDDFRQVFGVFVEQGLKAYALQGDSTMRSIYDGNHISAAESLAGYYDDESSNLGGIGGNGSMSEGGGLSSMHTHNPLDDIVLGCGGLSEAVCPWVPIWGMHKAVIMRYQDQEVLKTQELEISNDKCRFVEVVVLRMLPNIRANRAVSILSDGTVVVLHL